MCQRRFGAGSRRSTPSLTFSPAEVALALREIQRVLQPGGRLLLSFHIGEEVSHVEDLWGCAVCLDFYFFRPGCCWLLNTAGFEIDEIVEREPYAPEMNTRAGGLTFLRARRGGTTP